MNVATPLGRISQAEAWRRERAREVRDNLANDLERAGIEIGILYSALGALDSELGTDWSDRLDKIADEVRAKLEGVEQGLVP